MPDISRVSQASMLVGSSERTDDRCDGRVCSVSCEPLNLSFSGLGWRELLALVSVLREGRGCLLVALLCEY